MLCCLWRRFMYATSASAVVLTTRLEVSKRRVFCGRKSFADFPLLTQSKMVLEQGRSFTAALPTGVLCASSPTSVFPSDESSPMGPQRGGALHKENDGILRYPYKLIDTLEKLQDATNSLSRASAIALDLEAFCTTKCAMQLGQISLIQACSDAEPVVFLLDVLALSTEPVKQHMEPILMNANITKLFFDCRRDLEALSLQMGLSFCGVRDLQLQFTALQWKLRNVNRRSGMAYVLKNIAGVNRQESDFAVQTAMTLGNRPVWDVRPLPGHFLEYAADDVRHIFLLAPHLQKRCEGLVSLDAVNKLTELYVKHYATGKRITEEADRQPAEVNQDWLEHVVGPGGVCNFCGSKGHTEEECFKKLNGTARCSFCNELGHTSRKCYKKFPQLLKCEKCRQMGHTAANCFRKNPCKHCGGFHNSAYCYSYLRDNVYFGGAVSAKEPTPTEQQQMVRSGI